VSTEPRQFQIYLPGLLRVLAESLYSDERVAIRELLQNAHDSCVRRSVEDNNGEYRPRITVSYDTTRRVIAIQDNGSGLTASEIEEYLSTIGRSYTRQLGENLSYLQPEEADRLIGQFGLGFLSAFLIAEEVVLTTRSFRPESATLQWRSKGDINYFVTSAPEERQVGTLVEVILKPTLDYLLERENLVKAIHTYANFLPIPIHLAGEWRPINMMVQPWDTDDPDAAIQRYIEQKCGFQSPLYVLKLKPHTIDLGHDTMEIPLGGFLFIPPGTVASLHEYGDLDVYIRHMFICEAVKELLPPWARFVSGVIDCPQLQPTASREQIQRDENYALVQRALDEQLARGLARLAAENPPVWRQIVDSHRDLMIGWAVKSPDFFEKIRDIITFRTTRGMMTLKDYLDLSDGTIYYSSHPAGALQDQVLSEGFGRPVIDASYFAEPAFLNEYALSNPGVRVVALDSEGSGELLAPASSADFASLLAYFEAQGVRAAAVIFAPAHLPAVMIYPRNAEVIRDAREALDRDSIASPFSDLIADFLHSQEAQEVASGTLHLNAASPLIEKLARMPTSPQRDAALELIHQFARLFSGRMLDMKMARQIFTVVTRALDTLTAG
jgi:molecular chaperone HtpG